MMKNNKIKTNILKAYYTALDSFNLNKIKKKYVISIMNSEKTIKYIKKYNCSIARYGDGEFDLMMQTNAETYQEISDDLSKQLRNVFLNHSDRLLICIPYPIVSTKRLKKHGKKFWRSWCLSRQSKIVPELHKLIPSNYVFGDSFVSRPYSGYKSSRYSKKIFTLLKELWDKKDVIFVEGNQTRLGVGNDLFDNAKSIKRILCPAENAFSVYDKIVETTLENWKGELIITALGPTATILASDLSKKGIQVLDLGHIDIQYEWFLTGSSFVPVKDKYTNEAANRPPVESCKDLEYLKQIIAEI